MIAAKENTEEYPRSLPKRDFNAWVSEAIWGHRIEAQPASATLLEFLGMAEGMFRKGKLMTKAPVEEFYEANQCIQLRNLLFNNSQMEEIARTQDDDDTAWDTWLKEMEASAVLGGLPRSFEYLRERFTSFRELVDVIRLLRRIVVDPGNDRGWTNRFIYPIGPAALYESLSEKVGGRFERNRVLFTRSGEFAYLMLTRARNSAVRENIAAELSKAFDPGQARNRLLLRLLEKETPDTGGKKNGTYIPYKRHPAFDRFAQDVDALLQLQLPDQDAFHYLQPLIAFHVYLYGIETANYRLDNWYLPPIVCEILAPRSDIVRRASVASYTDNEGLGLQAVRRYLDTEIFDDAKVNAQLQDPNWDDEAKKELLLDHLRDTCALHDRAAEQFNASDDQDVKRAFYNLVERMYRKGTASALQAFARNCGLASRRGTNRYRYAPTDELLRVLVMVNVKEPQEESDFLQGLYRRYRIVIGPAEARGDGVVEPHLFDENDFKKNRERFARHLIGMGLADRMSDACTYVYNPMNPKQ